MPALCWPTRLPGLALFRGCFQSIATRRITPFSLTHSPLSHSQSRFIPAAPYLQRIHNDLEYYQDDRWGWVFYRTTYKDDLAWDTFKRYINTWSRKSLPRRGASPAVLSALEWTFVSNQTTLDGVSREQLRHRFREWRKIAMRAENPRRDPSTLIRSIDIPQRYLYFIQVDEDSLSSVIESGGEFLDSGWVHLVRCDDELDGELAAGQEDEGWMMISANMVGAEFYDGIGTTIECWDAFYEPPPDVVNW